MKKTNHTLPILVMFLLYFIIAFVTNFAGTMGVVVKNQFGASNALSQLGTLANFIAYACMGIPAGIILKGRGYRFTSLCAVVVGIVGVGIQWLAAPTESFAVYVTGAFVAGFSMCMLNIVVNPMLNTLGGGGKRGNQLNLLGGSINSIGGTLAPVVLGYYIGGNVADANLGAASDAMMFAIAIFIIAFIVIIYTDIPEPHKETAEEKAMRVSKEGKDPYGPMSFRHFVLGAVAVFFYVGIEMGIPNTANIFMSEDPDEGPALAGGLIGAYWFLMMIGRLIGGALGGKVSSKVMLSTVSAVALCLVAGIIFVPEPVDVAVNLPHIGIEGNVPVAMLCMVFCGLCTSVMWGCIFNLSTEGLGRYTPLASGIFMVLVCGGGIMPFVQGIVADYIGAQGSYIVVMCSLLYILFYALRGSKNVNADIVTE
ncbi:MAG: MFS transporter [Paludibacteraceae bacterium]|nr:MFS transporter [Paludibacteraceae bacterium]